MAMTGISGLRAIGKSQDQELSLEEVERALFYTEWYGNCPFMPVLDSSVAAQPFQGIQLSSLWRFGAHLASEDMTIVLSSAQANVSRQRGLRMLTLAISDLPTLNGLLTDFEKGTGLAYDTLTQYQVPCSYLCMKAHTIEPCGLCQRLIGSMCLTSCRCSQRHFLVPCVFVRALAMKSVMLHRQKSKEMAGAVAYGVFGRT